MQRDVSATRIVDLDVGRARELVIADPAGVLHGPRATSTIRGALSLEIGETHLHEGSLVVPVACRVADLGPLHLLTGELRVIEEDARCALHLDGSYEWDGADGYGAGVLVHRFARWIAHDLVTGVEERLLERSTG